ncbi:MULTISPECIES: hypothetical protein [unclassified Streptomyces]|uniref:hypothetical protein n=1 Tax=unclassified Streptomyces TaxID=2593676 RepID=UPI003820070A
MASGSASGGSLAVGGGALGAGAKALTAGKGMSEEPAILFDPFHRLGNERTQSVGTARTIVESSELWGRAPKQGGNATAQAWRGPIPHDAKPGSFEFYTTLKPKAFDRSLPGQAAWEAEVEDNVSSFVKDGDEWASIPIVVTEVR